MSKLNVLAEPVIVGREKDLQELQSSLSSAVHRKGKTVFVSGEAGSGKTRLAREFLNSAVKQGLAVMTGWCLSDSQVPYFPFMEAFNNYFAASGDGETSLLQPQAQIGLGTPTRVGIESGGQKITSWIASPKSEGRAEVLSPQAWKDQVFVAVSEMLHIIAVQSPVVLFIEDVQWADSASLALLHYVARAVNNSERVLVLATLRSEELTADAEGRPHPLAETMRLMRREELFSEIKLSGLSKDSISKIAKNMIGGTLEADLEEKLAAESKGNPLFVVESLRMLHERKSLILKNDVWSLSVDDVSIPSKIKDIILHRLACLKSAQRRVLDAASVLGEEFDVELLSMVLGQDSLEVLEALNQIGRSTSLVRVEGSHYRFDHARSRETLYEELALPLKKGYHLRVAEKLERGKSARLLLSDLAFHYAQAGNMDKAVKFSLAAGKDELAKFSNEQAIRHFQYVLQNVPEGHLEDKNVALEGLGDAYAASYMYGEAMKTFEELASPGTRDLNLRLRAIRKASDAAYRKGDEREPLLEYAKKAQELGLDDRLEMARIISNRGKAWHWWSQQHGTNIKMAWGDYDAALRIFEEENSLADLAEGLVRSGIIHKEHFEVKGLSDLLRSVAIFRELGDFRREAYATRMMGQGFEFSGLFAEARREYANVLRIGEKLDVFTELAYSVGGLSKMDELDGKLEDALSKALKGLEYSKKTDLIGLQGGLYARLAALCGKLGELKKADEYFEELSKLPIEIRSANSYFLNAGCSEGVWFAAKSRWTESNDFFEKLFAHPSPWVPGREMIERGEYAWALERQGRFDDAKLQRDIVQNLSKQVEERFGHANLQFGFMVQRRVCVGVELDMRLDLVNVGRKRALLNKIEGIALPEFSFDNLPSFCSLKDGNFDLSDKSVKPFEVDTIKLRFSAKKAGSYVLKPEVFYSDDGGNTKTFKINPITITVEPTKPTFEVLAGRVTTGTEELDRLFLGGIPEKYAVVLTASPSDKRRQMIKNFVETGPQKGEYTIYLTCETSIAEELAKTFQTNFFAGICNPQVDSAILSLPNIIKLKGIENLTDIDIALTKLYRISGLPQSEPKRVCVDLISDVLLQHHAVTTRRWLSGLLASLKSKGFTMLAVLDPLISPEEVPAISSLFDGEIRIVEKATTEGTAKTLGVQRLHGQNYLKDEVNLG